MALSGGSWGAREELLHPRGRDGRFRRKWSLPKGAVDKIMGILDAFNPPTFRSQQQASQWSFNRSAERGANKFQDFARLGADFTNTNNDLRSGKMTPSTQKFITSYDKASFDSPEDMVLYRKLGPEAFGISPEMMNAPDGGIEDVLTGTTIVDKGYTSTNVGAPIGNGPITMAIAAPKGTKMMAPGRSPGDPQIILDRNQKLHVSKVEPDGKGGWNVMAVLVEEGGPEEHEVVSTGEAPSLGEREGGVQQLEDIRGKRMGVKSDKQVEQEAAERQISARVDQTLLQEQQQQRMNRMGKDRPVPQPTGGPPPRTEPLQSEVLGGRPVQQPVIEQPEDVRITDFREAFRAANIEVPSAGPRRRQFNQAYLGIVQGKKDPEDVLRELEADIRDNDALMDDLRTRETPRLEMANLEADIERQDKLAGLIAEQRGLERNSPPREPKVPEGEPVPEGSTRGGTDITNMPERQRTDVENRVQRLKAEGRFNPDNEEHQRLQNLVDQIEAEREGREGPAPFEQPRVSGVPEMEARKARAAARKAATPPAKKAAPAKKATPTPVKPTEEMTPEERIARLDEIMRGENVPGMDEEQDDALESMTRDQLVEEAKRRGIDRVPTSWNKTKIKDAIRKGEVSAKAAPATKATSTEAREAGDLDSMTKNDLLAEARSREVEVKDWWTKDRIKQAIRGETAPAKKALKPETRSEMRERTKTPETPEQAARRAEAQSLAEVTNARLEAQSAAATAREDELIDRWLSVAGVDRDSLDEMDMVALRLQADALLNRRITRAEAASRIRGTRGGKLDGISDIMSRTTVTPRAGKGTAPVPPHQPTPVAGPRAISRRAEGLGLTDVADGRIMDYLEGKQSGADTLFKGNDIGRALTDTEIADELEDLLRNNESMSPGLQARRFFRQESERGKLSPEQIGDRVEELRDRERKWRRLLNRLRGRHQETGINNNPAAARKMTTEDRKNTFSDAFDDAFPGLAPDSSGRRTILEVRDDIVSGRITPEEGVRRLESDIEFNREELTTIEADLRNTDNPTEISNLRRDRAKLTDDVKQQEKTAAFMRRHFRNEPETTPQEVKQALPEPMQRQLDEASPAELKQMAKTVGIEEPKGNTKEEVEEDLLSIMAKEVKRTGDEPRLPKKVAPPKAPATVVPTAEGKKWQRTDIQALAEGLDLTHPDDQKLLRGLQDDLDSEEMTPAALGKALVKGVNGPAGHYTRAAYAQGVGVNRQPHETDEMFQARRGPAEADAADLRRRGAEFEKLGERLQKVRRKANAGPPAPDPTPEVSKEERQEIANVSELTGIPTEQLEKRALAKKEADAPAKATSVQTTEVLDAIDDEQEQRALLTKKLKTELVDIAKAAGIKVLSKDTKPVIVQKILDKKRPKVAPTPSAPEESRLQRAAREAGFGGDAGGMVPFHQKDLDEGMSVPEVADRIRDDARRLADSELRRPGTGETTADLQRERDADVARVMDFANRFEGVSPERQQRIEENGRKAAEKFARDIEENIAKGASDRAMEALVRTNLKRYRAEGEIEGVEAKERQFIADLASDVDVNDREGTLSRIRARMEAPEALTPTKAVPAKAGVRDLDSIADQIRQTTSGDEVQGLLEGLTLDDLKQLGPKLGINNFRGTNKAAIRADIAEDATLRGLTKVQPANLSGTKAVRPLQAPPAQRPLTAPATTGGRINPNEKSSTPKMANSWGRPNNRKTEVQYHGDSAIARSIDALGDDGDISVDGDRLDNTLGRLARDNIDGTITQQEMIDRIQELGQRFPQNSAPRRVLESLADGMDTPDRSIDLPEGTPEPLRRLAETLSATPLARKEREGRPSALERLDQILKDWQAGKITPTRLTRAADAINDGNHESEDGYFDISRAIKQAGLQMRSIPRDQLQPPEAPKPVKKAAPAAPARARNITPAQMQKMSDDQLLKLFEDESRKEVVNEERLTQIYDEMGRRETASEAEAVARELAEAPQRERLDELVEGGMEYREAYAEAFNQDPEELRRSELAAEIDRDRMPGESREQAARRAFKEQVAIAYVQAEAVTNGHMLNPAGRAAGIDPFTLFTGNRARAEKYASDELKEFWEINGRPTFVEFKAQVLGRREDVQAARAKREGTRGFL